MLAIRQHVVKVVRPTFFLIFLYVLKVTESCANFVSVGMSLYDVLLIYNNCIKESINSRCIFYQHVEPQNILIQKWIDGIRREIIETNDAHFHCLMEKFFFLPFENDDVEQNKGKYNEQACGER